MIMHRRKKKEQTNKQTCGDDTERCNSSLTRIGCDDDEDDDDGGGGGAVAA